MVIHIIKNMNSFQSNFPGKQPKLNIDPQLKIISDHGGNQIEQVLTISKKKN